MEIELRHLMGVSILALSLAISPAVHAEDDFFRLNLSHTIFFSGETQNGSGPAEGAGNIEFVIDGQTDLDSEIKGRVSGALEIPVTVNGLSDGQTVSVTTLPPGASWSGSAIIWPFPVVGTHSPSIEVRDADGNLVASAELGISIYQQLGASLAETSYEAEADDSLTIVPEVENLIGSVQWGSIPSPLPNWLAFNAATGRIDVDTSAPNSLADIVLTAVDQDDLTSASTLPFSISVNGAATNYWITILGGASSDTGRNVVIASDGGIFVAGQTNSAGAGGYDLLLTKFNTNGEPQWQRTLGGGADDFGGFLASGSDGSLYVAGYTRSAGVGIGNLLLAKYDHTGALQWQRLLDGASLEYAQSVTVGSDGSVYVGGYTQSFGAGIADFLLAKYSASGALEWQRTLGGTDLEHAYGIASAPDGSVYITGYTGSTGAGSNDVLLAKYNAAGALQWQRTLGGTSIDQTAGIQVGPDGSVYITGHTYNGANIEALLAKYDASGVLLWQKMLGGSSTDGGRAITIDADGYIYLTGTTQSTGASGRDVFAAKYSSTGALQWQRVLGGTGNDDGNGIRVGADGSIYLTGTAGTGNGDLILARLPKDGGPNMVAGEFIFAESNLTEGTSSLVSKASTLNAATPTLTSGNVSLSAGTASLASDTKSFVEE